MSVTPAQRKSYRHAWRHLIEDCARAASDPAATYKDLGSRALDSRNWISPTDERSDTALFGALGPMAYAYARAATSARRQALAQGLATWAAELRAILDHADPQPARLPPTAPAYRADIDE